MFRAAVWDTGLELLLGLASVGFSGSSSRYGLLCLRPDLRSGSRIRTALERITCAAMLRMQTLVCFPERYYETTVS